MGSEPLADRGRPSYVWRSGQARRMALMGDWARVEGAWLLDVGCGVGLYTRQLARAGARAVGTEIELPRAMQARASGLPVVAAPAERLPFPDGTFDTVLLHEVLEHVADDGQALREVARVLVDGGRALVFVPNRWWPFETHGLYWRGRYRFGNAPLVNYLPDAARNVLAPHVRVYTGSGLRKLVLGLPYQVIGHTRLFPGFDRLIAKRPRLGRALRASCHVLERTPARVLGLSHLLVLERRARGDRADR
jgi:SAM-dependent methyltransferase